MEQLNAYMRVIKRHHFWILCALVVIVGLASWYLTVRSLAAEQAQYQSDIDSKYSMVSAVRNKQDHPNEHTAAAMQQLIDRRRKEVMHAWTRKFAQQREQNILTWPDLGGAVGKRFKETVEKLVPIEKQENLFPVPEVDLVIETYMRERYAQHVRSELPKLAERIGAQWVPALDDTGFAARRRLGEEPGRGTFLDGQDARLAASIVDWDPADQERIQREHFDFQKTPSSLQVLYAQEDLWVFTALMDIIKATNGNATVRHNAAVKQIDFIRIGRGVKGTHGTIYTPGAQGTTGEEAAPSGRVEEDYEKRLAREGGQAPADGEPTLQIDPADMRYVDQNYKALPGNDLRTGLNSNEPKYAYLQVAKRMPIQTRLKMDQRYIARLLVECANSNLTVEVRQVRVNPPAEHEVRRYGAGSTYGPLSTLTGTLPEHMLPLGPGGQFFAAEGTALDHSFPYDLTVEVYAIIYIYNPVDPKTLGVAEGEEETRPIAGTLASSGD